MHSQVRKSQLVTVQLLVNERAEVDFDVDGIVDGQAEEDSGQLKSHGRVEGGGVEPQQPVLRAAHEHSEPQSEKVVTSQVEELFSYPTLVDPFLSFKNHSQGLSEVLCLMRKYHRVL